MLEVKHLVKKYNNHLAVDDLNFTVEENEIFGFLGPNGAGKSTTMNVITGYLAPTSGHVIVDGHDIVDDAIEAKKLIGYLPELPPVYMDMTPKEYLKFVAEAKGVAKENIKSEIERVCEKTNITDVSGRLIKTLSKGYRQRVGMAQAILGNPKIIILDEPTVGLDPLQIIEFRAMIEELGKEHTVIISSHVLAEISEICHKIMIIVKGRLVAIDSPENLARELGDQSGDMSLENIFVKILEKQAKGEAISSGISEDMPSDIASDIPSDISDVSEKQTVEEVTAKENNDDEKQEEAEC